MTQGGRARWSNCRCYDKGLLRIRDSNSVKNLVAWWWPGHKIDRHCIPATSLARSDTAACPKVNKMESATLRLVHWSGGWLLHDPELLRDDLNGRSVWTNVKMQLFRLLPPSLSHWMPANATSENVLEDEETRRLERIMSAILQSVNYRPVILLVGHMCFMCGCLQRHRNKVPTWQRLVILGGATGVQGSASKSGIERERETSWSLESRAHVLQKAQGGGWAENVSFLPTL